VILTVRPAINLRFSHDTRKVLPDLELIGRLSHVERVPIEELLAVDESLIDENLHQGLPLKVPGIAHCNKVPVAAGFVEEVMDVLYSII
jgi:hypothetical protein